MKEYLSMMTASEYLINLREQLRDDIALKYFFLVDDDEIRFLKGSTAEHQHIKALHGLLRECQQEERELLCRYLILKKILEPKSDLYKRSTYLERYKRTPGLVSTNRLLYSHLYFAQHSLFKSSLIQDIWNSLSLKEKAAVGAIPIALGGGVSTFFITLKAGGAIPETGFGVLGRGVKIGAAQRAQMLNDIRQGVSANARATAGNPGIKIINKKAPPAIREQLKRNIKAGVQKDIITKGGKGFIEVRKVKLLKASGKAGIAMVFTGGLTGFLMGVSNVQSYDEIGIPLSPLERVNLFGRGFFSFLGVYPHPESVDQYIDESTASAKLIQHVTDFLRKTPSIKTYVCGLGHVSKEGKDIIVRPSHCSANLNQPKPDLGEEWYLPFPRGQRRMRKKGHKMSRKTPFLVSPDTEFTGVPAPDPDTEPSGSGLDADHVPYILENMVAVQNKTRAADSSKYVYCDLISCNEGNIVGSEAEENVFDASQIPAEKLHFSNNILEIKAGTGITQLNLQNPNVFIGRPREMDRVDCSYIFNSDGDRPYIVMPEGAGSGYVFNQKVTNCPSGLISRHNYVYSYLSEPHQYDINQDEGAIEIKLAVAKELNLRFNLTMDELLQRVITHSEKKPEFDTHTEFTRLELNIDRMKITITLPSDAKLTLSDNKGTSVYFQVNEPNSLMLLEQVAKDFSTKEKLKACHHYQQRVVDKEMSCLLTNVITETETETITDLLFIDPEGRGWFFIADTESRTMDFIPVYSEGAYRLLVSDIEKSPSLAISFSIEAITYYRDGTNLILGRKGYSLEEFSLYFVKYFQYPVARWESLRVINIAAEALFDCDIGSHCLSGKSLASDSLNAISLDDQMKAQEQKLFEYYSFSSDTQARQKIYPNQRLSESGEWQTVPEKEKRFPYIRLEGFIPTHITVQSEDSALIFGIETDNNRFEISANNENIEGVIFKDSFSVSLSNLDTAERIEKRLQKSLLQAHVHDQVKQSLSLLQLAQVKALLLQVLTTSSRLSVNNREALEKSFEFWGAEDLGIFYALSLIQPVKNSALKLFISETTLKATTKAFYCLAVSTCLVTYPDALVKRLFPMLGSEEVSNLCNMARSNPLQATKQWIRASITSERLESIKTWLVKASNVNIVRYSAKPLTEVFYDPGLDAAGEGPPTIEYISHQRYVEGGDSSDTETQGFIDLSNKPDIVEVNVSQEDEWFKFTFISNGKFNYRPMKVKWNDPNQRIEGIIKDNDVVEGLTGLDDPALIEARINTVFSPEREWQVEEPRVGAQVHSAYQEEQMLGDQPVNGFIHEESHASHSMAPLQLSTNAANSPSLMGIITNGVEVNSNLLALQMLLGNKVSSRIPNFSIESQKEERIKALASTIIPKLIEYEENGEESETESASGFLNKLPLLGVLGAGVVSIIGGLVYWVKKRGAKNLPSNDDLEEMEIAPLNPGHVTNLGGKYDQNPMNQKNEYVSVPQFGFSAVAVADEEGSGGSSSFSSPVNDLFAYDSDCHEETKSQKKIVKHAQERVA